MKRFAHFIFFAVVVAGFYSCLKPVVFPTTPSLKFKKFIQSGHDSLQVVFSFTDGDGDIGVAPNEVDSNMVLTLYHKNSSGQWVFVPANCQTCTPSDSLYYSYRIPQLTAAQNGLEGDIYITMNRAFMPYDTLE